MNEPKINLFQGKGLIMKLMENGVPSIIDVKNCKHLYFKELNDSFYAIFMYYNDPNDLHIKLNGKREEALNHYIQMYECYENLISADGGLIFTVDDNKNETSDI